MAEEATTMTIRSMAVVATLVLAGCYSEFPADSKPQVAVDRQLLGTWWCPSGDHFGQLKVKARDEFWYEVTWREPGEQTGRYVGFASSIGGRTVINLKPAGAKLPRDWDHPWTFVAVSLSNGALHMPILSHKVLTGKEASGEEVRHAIEGALVAGNAFEEDEDTPCRRSR
jgi:hypothetical protein